ncbi:hypothetical protein Dxin01_03787 [Deinococcus xinjiangensis]|uniref:Uncharacterized protein n=1 Tax=Deinococcus xinjiangensis TaxID=457454 RepID=A0ABP9VFL5_9DEIO
MGYDISGTWHAQNADGSFTELDLGELDGDALSDWGRNRCLFALLGLAAQTERITPLQPTPVPAGLDFPIFHGAPKQGCVTLTDLLAYDYSSPEWQRQGWFAFEGHRPIEIVTRRLREVILPRVQTLSEGREVFFTYTIG